MPKLRDQLALRDLLALLDRQLDRQLDQQAGHPECKLDPVRRFNLSGEGSLPSFFRGTTIVLTGRTASESVAAGGDEHPAARRKTVAAISARRSRPL
ncbi:MAG: hypothetical protein ACRDFW_02350 [bacterium]